ncbi:hypothetical protein GCM10022244_25040 [Streptomyces gulbargensis]|uniref:Uncharacterized protein n=1 Tax=Streptomyces gulbargensis TaxID=364901 RepID=A0ABP7M5J6_9ACTN
MDNTSGDAESHDDAYAPPPAPPWSGREWSALQLELAMARTDADRKHILDTHGVTFEHLDEQHVLGMSLRQDGDSDDG